MRWIVLAVCVLGIGVSPLSAQSKSDNNQPAGTTRVAVVNIGYVFNNYVRAKTFKAELENSLKEPREEAKKLVDDVIAWEKATKKPNVSAAARDRLEDKIREAKRELEDLNRRITKMLGKKSEDNLVTLWKEVQAGVRDYAVAHQIDVVFAYGDPIEKDLLDRFPNVNRKMQAMDSGSSIPFFFSPRADISRAVTELLNRRAGKLPSKRGF